MRELPWEASEGDLKDVSAPDLGATAIRAAVERAGLSPEMVDEVVFGNALQATEAGYAARLAALRAGLPEQVPTIAINRQCSSGLEAINLAAQLVRTGEVSIAVAGGAESMSQVPYMLGHRARFDGLRMGDVPLTDGLVQGLSCPVNYYHMGVTAENVAERFEVSREDQDELALISHRRPPQPSMGVDSSTRSPRSQSLSAEGTRSSSTSTTDPGPTAPSRSWPSSGPSSRGTAPSPPVTPPPSTTEQPRS